MQIHGQRLSDGLIASEWCRTDDKSSNEGLLNEKPSADRGGLVTRPLPGQNRTVLVTGASRGIGLELARQYAVDGWRVAATARHPDNASELVALATASEGRVAIHRLDVADTKSIESFARAWQGPIDLLINNAALKGPPNGFEPSTWLGVLTTNLLGPMLLATTLLDAVALSERRLIVNLTSAMGSIGLNSTGGWGAYRTSKAALNMAMRTLSLEVSERGVIVVLMNPGWVSTEMGGASARLTPTASVSAMRRIMAGLGLEDSGRFLSAEGEDLPW